MKGRNRIDITATAACCILAAMVAKAQAPNSSSKRGMSYSGDAHDADYDILLRSGSPVSWYFTWSPWPASPDIFPDGAESRIEFVPTLHGIDNLEDDVRRLNSLPDSSQHLFTFNEPDGTTDSGGSNIEPEDAARAYIEQVVPLRDRFRISHPSVTGSGRGLDWLKDFNSSCWEIDSTNGCPADFVVAHWYGDFGGITSWLGSLADWYNQSMSGVESGALKIWVSEMALVQADEDATFAMMNQTLPYLDELDYVEKYAWFGVFRPDEANQWTGDGVSLFRNDGGLTTLGAYYLGGEENGFRVGDMGQGNDGNGNDDDNPGGSPDDEDDGANAAAGLRTSLFSLWVLVALGCFWNI